MDFQRTVHLQGCSMCHTNNTLFCALTVAACHDRIMGGGPYFLSVKGINEIHPPTKSEHPKIQCKGFINEWAKRPPENNFLRKIFLVLNNSAQSSCQSSLCFYFFYTQCRQYLLLYFSLNLFNIWILIFLPSLVFLC